MNGNYNGYIGQGEDRMMRRENYLEPADQTTKRGRPAQAETPKKKDLLKLYVIEHCSFRKVSGVLGCIREQVHYWLHKYGIEVKGQGKAFIAIGVPHIRP